MLSDEVVEQEGLGVGGGRAVWHWWWEAVVEVRRCGMKGFSTADDYKPQAAAECG